MSDKPAVPTVIELDGTEYVQRAAALHGDTVTVEVVPAEQLREAVVLDDETLASLDERAAIHGTDRAAYLRWVLTGATNATPPGRAL